MNPPPVGMLILWLLTAAALSGCQHSSQHYRMVQKSLKASYENGDLTRDEYEEAQGRYRKASRAGNTGEQAPENGFSF